MFSVRHALRSLGLYRPVSFLVNWIADKVARKTVVCSREGIRYRLDLSQVIDRNIYFGGWESDTILFLQQSLKSGDTVIEVGANIGAHTLLIAKAVSPGAVWAFEPTRFAREKLLANISLNPEMRNIFVRSELVSNASEPVSRVEILASWRMDGKPSTPENLECPIVSIDDFQTEAKLSVLSMIKIDVDGYDYKVLQGAQQTLLRFRPIVFVELCEYALQTQGDSVEALFGLMSQLRYDGFDEKGNPLTVKGVLTTIGMKSSINGVFRPN